jgi:hypothetical protein
MMRKVILLSLSLLVCAQLFGQAKLLVDKELHNYGKIYESDRATCLFTISNAGKDTLRITEVQPECGCTVPEISKKVIAPGESAVMKVKYKAQGRVGQFQKKIAIHSNSNPTITMVYIAGDVQPDQNKQFNVTRTASDLYLNKKVLYFDTLNDNEKRTFSIIVMNDGEFNRTVLGFRNLPNWITANTNSFILKPGEQKEIFFTLNGAQFYDYGPVKKYFFINTNDKANASKMVLLQGFVVPYFETPPKSKRKLRKWKLEQPKAIVGKVLILYGTIASGATARDTIHLTNTGGDTLKVKKIFSPCACMRISVDKAQIAPGEKAVVTVVFDSINRKGRQRKTGYLLLNDPYLQKLNISVDGQVTR